LFGKPATILLLLGEKAGLREDGKTVLPPHNANGVEIIQPGVARESPSGLAYL
jgi:hypothetical protein